MSEYEPGTVALIDWRNPGSSNPSAERRAFMTIDGRWFTEDGSLIPANHVVTNIRPLHFLADDEVAVKADDLRLVQTLRGASGAALHRLLGAVEDYDAARTPQIEEPLGVGAVASGADKMPWTRWSAGVKGRVWVNRFGEFGEWSDIKATRVLSEGVRLDEETGR